MFPLTFSEVLRTTFSIDLLQWLLLYSAWEVLVFQHNLHLAVKYFSKIAPTWTSHGVQNMSLIISGNT